jgi:hypothetical protein
MDPSAFDRAVKDLETAAGPVADAGGVRAPGARPALSRRSRIG